MISRAQSALAALATAALLAGTSVHAQQSGTAPSSARPANPAANLPSDTGSQTTLPSGAVTGAGQPQGTTRQPDVGAPGGLERRARREARGTGGTGATAAGAEGRVPDAAPGEAGRSEGGPTRTRPARRSKG